MQGERTPGQAWEARTPETALSSTPMVDSHFSGLCDLRLLSAFSELRVP